MMLTALARAREKTRAMVMVTEKTSYQAMAPEQGNPTVRATLQGNIDESDRCKLLSPFYSSCRWI